MEEERGRLEQLRGAVREHDHRYHVLDSPTISDAEYDRLVRELREIEARHPDWVTPDSPTQRVGGQPASGFATVEHPVAMLSLDNVASEEEALAFDARLRRMPGPGPYGPRRTQSSELSLAPPVHGCNDSVRKDSSHSTPFAA